MVGGGPITANTARSARPASSGITRQTRGGYGVTRRATQSGDTWTRRSAISVAMAAATGTPSATASTSARLRDRSLVKNGAPVNGMAAMAGRSSQNNPNPTATPATAATADSTAETTATGRGVAPASRMAAKRCSRRAADSRLAVPMKISTGDSRPAAPQDRIRSMPLLPMPTPTTQSGPSQPLGGIVSMLATLVAPGA